MSEAGHLSHAGLNRRSLSLPSSVALVTPTLSAFGTLLLNPLFRSRHQASPRKGRALCSLPSRGARALKRALALSACAALRDGGRRGQAAARGRDVSAVLAGGDEQDQRGSLARARERRRRQPLWSARRRLALWGGARGVCAAARGGAAAGRGGSG
eukprot:3289505-Pleurochrysis_carterae.AAC.1